MHDRGAFQTAVTLPPDGTHSALASSQPCSRPAGERWLLFKKNVDNLTQRSGAEWTTSSLATPCLGPIISLPDKLDREARAAQQIEQIRGQLRQPPRSTQARGAWEKSVLQIARDLARHSLGLPEAGLDLFFTQAAFQATRQFVRDARAFDPGIKDQSLLQALRNLWVVHCIQLLLAEPLSLLPATFGYSMLYPWTDNCLDDPQLAARSKTRFCRWLEQRLQGRRPLPVDTHAAQVDSLVSLIEQTYPRSEFEDVYFSLRTIHHAQIASLKQQRTRPQLSDRELLQTTLRKGGTSVLTDAWLVKGRLTQAQAEFMFGYGVVLQMMDDLQDVQNDLTNGHTTIFSRQAGVGCLDGLTSKLWSFAEGLLRSPLFEAQTMQPLRSLIQESWKLLVLQAIARNPRLFSAAFSEHMERSSPFGFTFMRDRESSFAEDWRDTIKLLRQQWDTDPAA